MEINKSAPAALSELRKVADDYADNYINEIKMCWNCTLTF